MATWATWLRQQLEFLNPGTSSTTSVRLRSSRVGPSAPYLAPYPPRRARANVLGAQHRSTAPFLKLDELKGAYQWAAGGFTLLSGVLLFFGIKEGVLDQALRLQPAATLCVFVLLGLGVLLSLFAPAVSDRSTVRVWAVVAALLLLFTAAGVFLPDIADVVEQQGALLGADADPHGGAWRPALLVAMVLLAIAFVVLAVIALEAGGSPVVLFALAMTGAGSVGLGLWLWWPGQDPAVLAVPDVASPGGLVASVLVLGLLGVLLWTFVRGNVIPTLGGLVVLAVTSTALGLYGGVKLAVQTKMLAVVPQVDVAVLTEEGTSTVETTVAAGRLRGLSLVVETWGRPRLPTGGFPAYATPTDGADSRGFVRASSTLFEPDALDEIQRTTRMTIVPERWDALEVRYCLVAEVISSGGDDPDCPDDRFVTASTFRSPAAELDIAKMSGHVRRVDGRAFQASFRAAEVRPGVTAHVEVCRSGRDVGSQHVVSRATVAPDEEGKMTWSTAVRAVPRGQTIILRQRMCLPGEACEPEWIELARATRY